MGNVRREYPRPQFRRKDWLALNGEWEFEFDDNADGETRGLTLGETALKEKINVPFTYQSEASGIGDETQRDTVWYRRSFYIEKKSDKRALLCFNGSDYITDVWVNGAHAIKHVGAYAPFQSDITSLLREGENKLVVKCVDTLDASQPRGKQSWKEGKRFGCWYIPASGIWQSVWIEFFGEDCIDKYTLTPDIDSGNIYGMIETLYGKAAELEVAAFWQGKEVARKRFTAEGKYIKYNLNLTENGENVALWSPETPNLYDVEFSLYKNGTCTDEAKTRVGMRKISIENGKICLNHQPYYQRLILDQGYWKESGVTPPSVEALEKDLKFIKAMGFNGARKHQKLEDPYYYYLADELGLLTWCEMPSAYNFNEKEVANVSREWLDIVAVARNFTSVVAYVPLNESWGVDAIAKDKYQLEFARGLYYLTKAVDDSRIISTNDGWENPNPTDIVSIHDYAYDSSEFKRKYIDTDYNVLNPVGRKLIVGGDWYDGQPVMFTEFGGVAMKKSVEGENWGYGKSADSDEEFFARLENLMQGVYTCPFQGYCYTQLSDVQQEVNGLLDENHEPKFSIERLNKVFG